VGYPQALEHTLSEWVTPEDNVMRNRSL